MSTAQIFEAGDVELQSGRTFRNMRLSYKTYGQLNASRDNVIVYPTSYSAQHTDIEYLVGPGRVLDSSRYFVVIVDLFGNGLSSSPSNTPWPDTGDRYPNVTYHDAVSVQHRLVTETLGVERIALVYGWSMGAMQAYHWAAMYPDMVERIAVVCGSARCAEHNRVFIDGVRHALMADPHYLDGQFTAYPVRGLRAMGRIYAGWALSQDFYRNQMWQKLGASSLEDFLVSQWEVTFARRDPADLLAQFWTWENGDISANQQYNHDLPAALRAIRARVLLMPGSHDLYFRVADNENELACLSNAQLAPIASVWGHRAGNPAHPTAQAADRNFIQQQVSTLLKLT